MYELIKMRCSVCDKVKQRFARHIYQALRAKRTTYVCSKRCKNKSQITGKYYKCTNCQTKFYRQTAHAKTKNLFCSKRCAAIYNNRHHQNGSKGYRRSKLEQFMEHTLTSQLPDLEMLFNRRDIIGTELDIYIPSLKLAFEINGIWHYKPIRGQKVLQQIQANDKRKQAACKQQGITLRVINTADVRSSSKMDAIKYTELVFNSIKQS